MALARSKYCQGTLPLPFDPLRLIFFITPRIVCLNKQRLGAHITGEAEPAVFHQIRFVSFRSMPRVSYEATMERY